MINSQTHREFDDDMAQHSIKVSSLSIEFPSLDSPNVFTDSLVEQNIPWMTTQVYP